MTDTSLHIDLAPEFCAVLQSAADRERISVQQFVQEVLKEAARREMEDIQAIREGLAQAERGECVAHADVMSALDVLLNTPRS